MIEWILTALSIGGALLNSNKRVEGFYFWLVGNAGWLIFAIQAEHYGQAVLWAFYFGICINGIYQWRKQS